MVVPVGRDKVHVEHHSCIKKVGMSFFPDAIVLALRAGAQPLGSLGGLPPQTVGVKNETQITCIATTLLKKSPPPSLHAQTAS